MLFVAPDFLEETHTKGSGEGKWYKERRFCTSNVIVLPY